MVAAERIQQRNRERERERWISEGKTELCGEGDRSPGLGQTIMVLLHF